MAPALKLYKKLAISAKSGGSALDKNWIKAPTLSHPSYNRRPKKSVWNKNEFKIIYTDITSLINFLLWMPDDVDHWYLRVKFN
jgi:hypothetical protein